MTFQAVYYFQFEKLNNIRDENYFEITLLKIQSFYHSYPILYGPSNMVLSTTKLIWCSTSTEGKILIVLVTNEQSKKNTNERIRPIIRDHIRAFILVTINQSIRCQLFQPFFVFCFGPLRLTKNGFQLSFGVESRVLIFDEEFTARSALQKVHNQLLYTNFPNLYSNADNWNFGKLYFTELKFQRIAKKKIQLKIKEPIDESLSR